jgi:hypothetical protein
VDNPKFENAHAHLIPGMLSTLHGTMKEEGAVMITNRSMPSAVIILELPYPDVREAVEWLCRTFGFVERLRIANHRAQLSFGEESLVVTHRRDGSNASFNVMVRVNDIERHYEHAKSSGAKIVSPPND